VLRVFQVKQLPKDLPMSTILINHRVPISGEPGSGALIFSQWLPEGIEGGLYVPGDPLELRIWLDRTCVRSPMREPLTDELISKWVGMPVESLFVDVTVTGVADELAAFVQAKQDWLREDPIIGSGESETQRLAEAYMNLGWTVLGSVLEVTNRIAAWAYAEGGQYWLRERDEEAEVMMSRNIEFHARASVDAGPWVRWCPPFIDTFNIGFLGGRRGLRQPDWNLLQAFLLSKRRPTLFRELMSNARALLSAGNNRSAIIEAVSGLEVAFRAFIRRPDITKLRDAASVQIENLSRDSERLGFSASLRYLLPIVTNDFENHMVEHAETCGALETRHNIVHNGQREVPADVAEKHVRAVAAFATFLHECTASEAA
jgi:hypothetical protein